MEKTPQPTPDSEPLFSNAVHTKELWEKIGNFLGISTTEEWEEVQDSKGTN